MLKKISLLGALIVVLSSCNLISKTKLSKSKDENRSLANEEKRGVEEPLYQIRVMDIRPGVKAQSGRPLLELFVGDYDSEYYKHEVLMYGECVSVKESDFQNMSIRTFDEKGIVRFICDQNCESNNYLLFLYPITPGDKRMYRKDYKVFKHLILREQGINAKILITDYFPKSRCPSAMLRRRIFVNPHKIKLGSRQLKGFISNDF